PDLKKEKAVVGGKEMDYTYGDCQKEMDMINLAYLEVIGEGDANGRTFSFPIPTYNLTKDFDWDGEIAQRLFQAAAKYGTPYFQNYIGSDLDPSSVRAMCCRLNMDLTQLMNRPGGMWSMGDSSITGNTPVWIKIGETWKMKPIEEVYKEGLKGLKTISFNPLTAEIEEVGVAQCVKHGKRNVFKLRTNQGNISITQDHCMFNVTDGGDVANATIEDIKRTGYFLAPRLPKIGSVYRLNVAENLIEGGYSDKRARVLIKNTTVFDRLMGCEISKRYVRKFYKNSFTDIKSKWKNSNFGKPTIAFNLFKLLYKAGKIRAKDLKEMHLCKIKHKLPLLLDLGYELGFITGLFLAEGSCHEACLAANDDVELLKLCRENARKALGIKPVLYKPRKGKVGLVTFNSPFVANYLKFGLGLEGHSSTKAVPEYIPNSNEDMIKGVIDGFYLGDGHETKDYIELATSSKKLAEGLMLLLKRIRGRFALRYYKKGGSYTVRITEYDGRAVSIKRKLDKDIRHLMGVFSQGVAELKKQISTTDAVKMGLPQAFYNPQYIPRESNVLKGIAILKRRGLMSGYFSTVARFMENYERVDVLDISYSGQNDVYDLSVPGYENFIAGPGMFFTHNTGSIGVVTINLNRIGYEAKNRDEFFQILRERMELAKQAHEIKRKVIETNLKNGLMPYTKRYLGTFNNHFSTIGLCGMNEACMNLLGKDISTPEGKQLAIDTLNFMRERTREYQQETGNLYNLEATPAESTSYRFGKMDKEMCPDIITSGTDVPYVTNSSQLPVDWTDDPIKAIEHQNDIQPLYTGGTIFHTFLGEKMTDWKAARDL
ncbi:MAG: anaerobic ribonucleoside-triphosphate reductase, partial [Candidatus Aenigmatarchaeota archaeon]